MNVNFEYELPSGQTVLVEAEVSPVIPAISPSLAAPGEPAEGGDVDILSTRLVCLEDTEKSVEIELDGLFFRGWRKDKLTSIIDDIEEYASSEAERWAA